MAIILNYKRLIQKFLILMRGSLLISKSNLEIYYVIVLMEKSVLITS